jgi:hypothetical protein
MPHLALQLGDAATNLRERRLGRGAVDAVYPD